VGPPALIAPAAVALGFRFLVSSEYGVGVGLLLVGVMAFALTLWGVSGDPPERSE
jgi:hypothetical protein